MPRFRRLVSFLRFRVICDDVVFRVSSLFRAIVLGNENRRFELNARAVCFRILCFKVAVVSNNAISISCCKNCLFWF